MYINLFFFSNHYFFSQYIFSFVIRLSFSIFPYLSYLLSPSLSSHPFFPCLFISLSISLFFTLSLSFYFSPLSCGSFFHTPIRSSFLFDFRSFDAKTWSVKMHWCTHIHTYIYICMCIYMRVCVWMRVFTRGAFWFRECL